jgi:hypothetical protein
VAAPRRALLLALLVRDEAASVANYLSADVPRLAAEDEGYDAICATVAAAGLAGGLAVTCDGGALTVTPP